MLTSEQCKFDTSLHLNCTHLKYYSLGIFLKAILLASHSIVADTETQDTDESVMRDGEIELTAIRTEIALKCINIVNIHNSIDVKKCERNDDTAGSHCCAKLRSSSRIRSHTNI